MRDHVEDGHKIFTHSHRSCYAPTAGISLMDSDLFKPRSQSFLSSMIDYGGCGSTWSPLYTMKRDAFHEMNPFDIFARPHPVLI